MKKIVVIHNKNSRGKKLTRLDLQKIFDENQLNCDIYQTKQSKEVEVIIKKYIDDEVIFCAVGGDGTLSNLIDVLLKNNIANPEVACLPSGSGSDFMRTFAFPKTINEGVERLKTIQDYKIDVAYIKSENNILRLEAAPKSIPSAWIPLHDILRDVLTKAMQILSSTNFTINNNA